MIVLFLLACGHAPPATALPATRVAQDRVDWKVAGDEAVSILAGYLGVDTQNPPGNETLGAEYLGKILTAEGIPFEIAEYAPGRGSLIARLEGGDKPPLCLLSHIDTVGVEAERWTHPPFGGELVDGYLYGRGALDMKSLGVTELLTVVWMKRLGIVPDRDIVLLAVADEEVDNTGIKFLAGQWDRIGCSHVINEGGIGVRDALLDGQTVYPISVAEKGHLWVKMIAHGTPGHGSTPRPDEAPARLVEALARLGERDARADVQAPMVELMKRVGREKGGIKGAALRSGFLRGMLVRPKLMADPVTRATVTNTAHVTGFTSRELEPNVVPSEATAVLDCRVLPGTAPATLLAELIDVVDDDKVTFEVISSMDANETPWDDPLFDALTRNLVDGRDHVVAGPFISIGSTDSQVLRPLGVRAYGLVPFEIDKDLLIGMHGDDERVPVDQLRDGLRRFFGAIVEFTAG